MSPPEKPAELLAYRLNDALLAPRPFCEADQPELEESPPESESSELDPLEPRRLGLNCMICPGAPCTKSALVLIYRLGPATSAAPPILAL